ncbi:MAG: methyl-accepting chemotaxis protein [Myxococcales bacterium]
MKEPRRLQLTVLAVSAGMLAAGVTVHLLARLEARGERRDAAQSLAGALVRQAAAAREAGADPAALVQAAVDPGGEVARVTLRDAAGVVLGDAKYPGTPRSGGEHRLVAATTGGLTLELELADPPVRWLGPHGLSLAVLGLLLAALGFATWRWFQARARRVEASAAAIVEGDLARPLGEGRALLAARFDQLRVVLQTVVVDRRTSARTLSDQAGVLRNAALKQAALASEQSSALVEAALTIGEIAATSKQASAEADRVLATMGRSEEVGQVGKKAVDDTLAAMVSLVTQVELIGQAVGLVVERTTEIGHIAVTVQDLADQSGMLALNAGIEASRAGVAGAGFAVVAQEMRTLSTQSKAGATRIRGLLAELHTAIRQAVVASGEGLQRAAAVRAVSQTARTSIDSLAAVIAETSSSAQKIASQSGAQTATEEQVASGLNELSTAMKQLLELSATIESVSSGLTALAEGVAVRTEKFRV